MKKLITLIAATLALALTAMSTQARPDPDRMFDRMDADGDGLLTLTEMQAREPRRLRKMDTNDDGGLSLDEMLSAMEAHQEKHKKRQAKRAERMANRVREQFTKLDENADGVVMPDEIRLATFTDMDANGDGFVSKDEAATLAKSKRGMREATWLPWHEKERKHRRHKGRESKDESQGSEN